MWDIHLFHFTRSCLRVCVQSCLNLCDSIDCSPLGSSVHGIFQARIPEWVAISHSRESSWLRDRTHISWVSCIGRQVLYHCATWDASKWFLKDCPNLHLYWQWMKVPIVLYLTTLNIWLLNSFQSSRCEITS